MGSGEYRIDRGGGGGSEEIGGAYEQREVFRGRGVEEGAYEKVIYGAEDRRVALAAGTFHCNSFPIFRGIVFEQLDSIKQQLQSEGLLPAQPE